MPVDYALQARIAYLKWIDQEDTSEAAFVRTCRDYAKGEHPTYLTDRQKEFVGLKAKDADYLYAHNMCQLVIDAVTERLNVEQFGLVEEREISADADPSAWASTWWEANRMDAGQDDVYGAALRDGKAYLIVDWDADELKPRWSMNEVFDGTSGVRYQSDPDTGAVLYAVKKWQVYDPYNSENNGRTRMTLYFPDRVEKYITTKDSNQGIGGTRWESYTDAQGEPWPIPWLDRDGAPLGMPVFEFANPEGSEIAQLLPIQDMLNKADLDLIAATDSSGFRILFVAGVPPQIGTSGEESGLTLSPGRLLRFTDSAAKLGAVEAADPGAMIASSKYWIETAAAITRTPQYLFHPQGAEQPSGESLKQQEIGLVFKCERRQQVWGNVWENVVELSRKLYNLYGGGAIEDVPVSAEWQAAQLPTDPVAEETAMGLALKQYVDSGVPLITAARRLGWTEEEIKQLEADKKKADAERTSMAQALLNDARTQFDQGQNPAARDMFGQEEGQTNG
jgi:hypothetical protein